MKKVFGILILISLSVGTTYLLYSGVMWLLDKGSEILGRENVVGNFFEKALFWLSHLGFGLIIFLALVVLVFFILQKLLGSKLWLK
jgi:hypothetical protein